MNKKIIFILLVLLFICVIIAGCPKLAPEKAVIKGIVKPATSNDVKMAQNTKNAMDYTNPTTRDFALKIIPKSHSGEYSVAQICDLWQYAYSRWTYVNDPQGFEYWSPASRTINIGLKGDCDDFAILTTSLIQSIGGSSRVVVVPGHAYPEVYIGNNKEKAQGVINFVSKRYNVKSIYYHHETDSAGVTKYWMNLDWSAKHPGGPFHEDNGEYLVIYPNGNHYRYKNSD